MTRSCALTLVVAVVAVAGASAQAPSPATLEFFEKEVRPLLAAHCLKCHGDDKPKAMLRLTARDAVLTGGDSGPAAVPGKPDDSLLVKAVRYRDDLKMPPKEKLGARDVATLTRWVTLGLPWPETDVKPSVSGPKKIEIGDEQRRFWSFQPVKSPPAPHVKDASWPRADLDRHVLAALEAKGLRPAKPADRRTLIRRATFDLTGLPPTPEDVDAFLKDDAADAFAKVVDRLLSSPAHGERWARHWLDVVRYTDSFDARIVTGGGSEMDVGEAWRYRDWVVEALNRDLPYDQFLTLQLAGDLVPGPDGDVSADGVVATGLLAFGNWGGGDADKEKLLTDIADDQVDVVSRAFMGLTLACARCHDHKFDPLSQEDYYGLAGIFFSTHILPDVGPKTNGPPMLRIPLLSKAEAARRAGYAKRVADLEKALTKAREGHYLAFAKGQAPRTADYLMAAWAYQDVGLSLDAFAARRGLVPFALRQWLDALGQGDYRLMTKKVRDVLGAAGVHVWKGEPDCPSLTVNTTNRALKLLTFTLPPRSVSVHPGPSNGVAVGWKSPVAGAVRISGGLRDADPAGGDGVAWVLDHRRAGGRRELASGDLPNGGAQKFADGKNGAALASVLVSAGDTIELLVLPKMGHACDTTVVDLTIRAGGEAWDVTADLVDDPHQGNPHRDRRGNAAVWHFYDMADSNRARQPVAVSPALAAWHRAAADIAAGKASVADLGRAAAEAQKAFDAADARNPFRIKERADEKYLPEAARAELTRLASELDALRKNPPAPVSLANGAQEGGVPGSPHAGVHDVRVHLRGRYDRLGDLVPRRFPVVLAGAKQPPIKEGSGRLQLARWLTRPDHPLTARVLVNRLWQGHFGEGLVRTPSNFGKLGERPSHPELLDGLADQFVRGGWSMKQMHRAIMLSATYRQSSEPEPETLNADPENRLFGHMNRRRLEAEAVRDSLLSVAGRLDPTRGGKATRDFNLPRRTLYQMTIRSDRSGFLPLFDVADPTAPVEKRTVSTVAPQALFLMNDPFVLAQTKALAKRVEAGGGSDTDKMHKAYFLLYGRPPTGDEISVGLGLLRVGGQTRANEAAWREYCQVLLCANEFLYVD